MAIFYKGGGADGSGASLGTIAGTFTPDVTAGSLLVAVISWGDSGSARTVTGVTDSRGNTWTVLTKRLDATNQQALCIAYAMNAAAGATTVTAAFSVACADRRIVLAEYSGLLTASALDVHTGQAAANTTAANNVSSGAATTTAAGDLIVGGFMDSANGSNTQTAGTGFTNRNSFALCILEDLIQTSAGSVAATQTWGTAGRYVGAMAAFKAASNTPPIVGAGPDQTNVEPFATVSLAGTASDPGGSVVSTVWSKVSGPTPLSALSSSTTLTPTYEARGAVAGYTDVWRLTATDNLATTNTDDVSVTVLLGTEFGYAADGSGIKAVQFIAASP